MTEIQKPRNLLRNFLTLILSVEIIVAGAVLLRYLYFALTDYRVSVRNLLNLKFDFLPILLLIIIASSIFLLRMLFGGFKSISPESGGLKFATILVIILSSIIALFSACISVIAFMGFRP
jgi:hypothetical protein